MALNIKDFLATFKKQTYISLIQNMDISFPSIKNSILQYATSQEADINSTLDLYRLDLKSLSSATINASIQLLYIDFYSMYTMLYSVFSNYQGLLDTSKNKYTYLSNLYKDMESILDSKELNKLNKYVTYTNFENKNSVVPYKSDIISRSGIIVNQLQYEDVMTLPVSSTKTIYPTSIVPISLDTTDSTTIINKGLGFNYFDIIRTQNDYVSLASSIYPTGQYVSNNTVLNISGSITDISLDSIYAKVVDKNGDVVSISYSSDGKDWSDPQVVPQNISSSINIEYNIPTGLYMDLVYDSTIKIDDSWIINFNKVQLPYPSTEFKIKFDKFDDMSFVTIDDISPYRLYIDSIKTKTQRYGQSHDQAAYIKLTDKTVIFQNSQIDECSIRFTQNDSDIYNNNGAITNKYSFYINDVKGISNEYQSQGSLSFNPIDVVGINNVAIDATSIQNDNMFVEYNIYAEAGIDKISIPCLASDQVLVNEYVLPTQTDSESEITYTTRFPVNQGMPILLCNLNTGEVSSVHGLGSDPYIYYDKVTPEIDYSYLKITIKDYNIENQYALKYSPRIWTSSDTYDQTDIHTWVTSNKVKFMYYKDSDLSVKLAIKQIDEDGNIGLFTGTLSSLIELRSVDKKYMSPYITQYKVRYN